jgi:predicted ATP-grasp superfamily ATP-dependent carboligase
MTTSNEIKSCVYEIKINRKWSKVRATSIKALSDWAKENNVSDWRMVGMMSISETKESQSLKVVA